MTIASSTRKAGPFTGDDASTVFAFSFKVFSAADLYVVKAVAVATGAETVLTLTTDYTVSLNADQNNSPGGTVTLTSVLASGHTLDFDFLVDTSSRPTSRTKAAFIRRSLRPRLTA